MTDEHVPTPKLEEELADKWWAKNRQDLVNLFAAELGKKQKEIDALKTVLSEQNDLTVALKKSADKAKRLL